LSGRMDKKAEKQAKKEKKAAALILTADKDIKEKYPARYVDPPRKEKTMMANISGRDGYKPFCGAAVKPFLNAQQKEQTRKYEDW
jgi:hypothetical protein